MAQRSTAAGAARGLEQAARGAAAEARPWIVRLARLGYAARGVVYCTVGLLAFRAAFGLGGETTGGRGAIRALRDALGSQPLGQAVLALVALGLAGFALWRLVQAIADPERKRGGLKGLALRAGSLASAAVYAGLTLVAVRLLRGQGGGSSGDDSAARGWTAELMDKPFGRWLVVAAGAILLGYGLRLIYNAVTESFLRHLATGAMSPTERLWARRAGKLGLAARGVVFVLSGGFLVKAGLEANPGEARGLGGTLDALLAQPAGPWLLALVAAGLIAFGIYSLVEARYRRIAPP
jgi:uncharacterized protein DUF1206